MQENLSEMAQEAVSELLTINDFLRWGVSRFNAAEVYFGHGTNNPWDECASLITFALNLTPDLNPELLTARLTKTEKQRIIDLIVTRIEKQVPAAYLTNVAYFCGLPFYVNEDVLVPRSPIGELITSRFEGFFENEPQRIMDLCTGSGCIAVACAYQFEEALVDALDISPEALTVADENIHRHGLTDRVLPIMSDVFSGVPGQTYDLIVSNPPYVDAEDLGDMPAEFHHEPEIGLGSGADGLDVTRVILREAASHLNEGGVLIVEVGNSMLQLQAEFPQVPFQWLEFENGGLGVFALTKQDLETHQALFNQ